MPPDAHIWALVAIFRRFAQGPVTPKEKQSKHYAEVVAFETGPEKDWAHIRLADWRGWQHDRWIYFYHNGGPIVILDEARGPARAKAELIWHLVGGEEVAAGHFRLRGGDVPAEMRLILRSDGGMESRKRWESAGRWKVVSQGAQELCLTTVVEH